MKNIIRLSIFIICIQPLRAQQVDSLTLEPLTINEEIVENLRAEKAFDYQLNHTTEVSFLDRIWTWFLNFLSQLFQWGGTSSIVKIIVYTLVIGAIIYAILKITNTSPRQLIRKDESNLAYSVHEEDIHNISFEDQIAAALESKNYKLAVRLNYLYALKFMSDEGIISWTPAKSNHEYLYEVSESEVRGNFKALSILFEYCWYGGFDVPRKSFNESKTLLDQLKHT